MDIENIIKNADSSNKFGRTSCRKFSFHIQCKNFLELSAVYKAVYDNGLESSFKIEDSISNLVMDISFIYKYNLSSIHSFVEKMIEEGITIRG